MKYSDDLKLEPPSETLSYIEVRDSRFETTWETRKDFGWVYFVLAREVNRVKIGFTTYDPGYRLQTIQANSPVTLKIIAVLQGPREWESKLHKKFTAWRLHGEWFTFSEEINQYVEFLREKAAR